MSSSRKKSSESTTRRSQQVTVITYGTFDLFHYGHLRLLQRLKALGTRLVVACSTDEFNAGKGKKAASPYEHRKAILESICYVDKVIPESSWDQKRRDIKREKADIFAIGDDWAGKFDDLKDLCEVVYLPRTQDVSTTEIKDLVAAQKYEKLREVKLGVERLRELLEKF